MKFGKLAFIIVVAGALCLVGAGSREGKTQKVQSLQPQIAEKILRFHVLANSDSTKDQNLKLKVRDAIGNYLAPILEEADNLQETKDIVEEQIPEIEAVAKECIAKEGYDYFVEAEVKNVDFPVKTYGDYTFPAGEYEALEVYIGEAEGQNWWCVLYPNMCFQGTVYEEPSKEADAQLQEVLTTEEYQEVFTQGNYRVEFKLLEEIQVFLDRMQETILLSDQ